MCVCVSVSVCVCGQKRRVWVLLNPNYHAELLSEEGTRRTGRLRWKRAKLTASGAHPVSNSILQQASTFPVIIQEFPTCGSV